MATMAIEEEKVPEKELITDSENKSGSSFNERESSLEHSNSKMDKELEYVPDSQLREQSSRGPEVQRTSESPKNQQELWDKDMEDLIIKELEDSKLEGEDEPADSDVPVLNDAIPIESADLEEKREEEVDIEKVGESNEEKGEKGGAEGGDSEGGRGEGEERKEGGEEVGGSEEPPEAEEIADEMVKEGKEDVGSAEELAENLEEIKDDEELGKGEEGGERNSDLGKEWEKGEDERLDIF